MTLQQKRWERGGGRWCRRRVCTRRHRRKDAEHKEQSERAAGEAPVMGLRGGCRGCPVACDNRMASQLQKSKVVDGS